MKLKEVIKERINGFLNMVDEGEYNKRKEIVQERYTDIVKCPPVNKMFSSLDNFELYDCEYVKYPEVCFIKSEVIEDARPDDSFITKTASLLYFDNETKDKMIFPIIIIPTIIYENANKEALDFMIMHEVGHYRLNHCDKSYLTLERSSIMELEADVYAVNSMGIEKGLHGMLEMVRFTMEYIPNANVMEILHRLNFIARKNGVNGILDDFSIEENKVDE